MCKTSQAAVPDTSRQDAEIERQRQIEIDNAGRQAEEERRRWEQQRADDLKRYEDQLAEQRRVAEQQRMDGLTAAERQREEQRAEAERQRQLQEAESNRQYKLQEDYLSGIRAEQAAQEAERQRIAGAQRDYSTGRQKMISDGYSAVDEAYSGFNDDFFGKFAQDFTDYYKPQLDREFRGERRDTKFAYADAGTLRSSMAADAFGELARKKAVGEGEIASNAQDRASALRADIEGQKSAAKSSLLGAATAADPVLLDSGDASAALGSLGSRLANLSTGAKSNASKITAVVPTSGGFTSLAGAVRKPSAYRVL